MLIKKFIFVIEKEVQFESVTLTFLEILIFSPFKRKGGSYTLYLFNYRM